MDIHLDIHVNGFLNVIEETIPHYNLPCHFLRKLPVQASCFEGKVFKKYCFLSLYYILMLNLFQTMLITTNVVSSYLAHGEVHSLT
jgi:hypothetical protein